VDEAVHVVLGDSLGDALSTVNVHVGVGEVPRLPVNCLLQLPVYCKLHALGRVLATSQVVDDIGVTDTLLDRLGVAEVVFLWTSQTTCVFGPSFPFSCFHTMKVTRPRSPVTFK
jgi:hypothetical protein